MSNYPPVIKETSDDDFARLCAYAFWKLEKQGDPDMQGAPINTVDLWDWFVDVANRTDTSEAANKVYAEAVAMRMEGETGQRP